MAAAPAAAPLWCTLTPLAGRAGFAGNADGDGALAARLSQPVALAFEPTRNATVVADRGNNRLRRVDAAGRVSTFGGSSAVAAFASGAALSGVSVSLQAVGGVAAMPDGGVAFCDAAGQRVGAVAPDGVARVIAGGGVGAAPASGFVDAEGVDARFNRPTGIACCTPEGALVVADSGNRRVRLVTPQGTVR